MNKSVAVEGFLLHKQAQGLSEQTIATYRIRLGQFVGYIAPDNIESITAEDITKFFHYLKTEYTPTRWGRDNTHPLSGRSLRNMWVTLKSFYTWAAPELGIDNPMGSIPAPKPNIPHVQPLTQEEIKDLVTTALTYVTGSPHPQARRNQAIIYTLLDTGLRASELCALNIEDVDTKLGKIFVSRGKGSKARVAYIGKRTRSILWRYIAERGQCEPYEPLFVTQQHRRLKRHHLRRTLKELGDRAGVANVYPHRFRHTFAINYLRNGGDIFTLQTLLGHSSLQMVRYYAQLADIDAEMGHRRASPADKWL